MDKYFYSKVLLFGEYGVILGGKALAIPYADKNFKGQFKLIDKKNISKGSLSSNKHLKKYLDYIKKQVFLHKKLDIQQFEKDIAAGLYFESSIPSGYGLGSSGALVAAIYDKYFYEKKNIQLADLQMILGVLESYFHGKSSGFDPLVCYLNQAVLKSTKGVEIVDYSAKSIENNKHQLFLLNTQKARQTEPLVHLFLDKCKKNSTFKSLCINELVTYNNNCIQAYLSGDADALWDNMGRLSAFQLAHFKEMIPDFLLETWREGLANRDFYLKLCGAGGGGFMLGIGKQDFLAKTDQLINKPINLF